MKKWLKQISVIGTLASIILTNTQVFAEQQGVSSSLGVSALPYYASADFTPHWLSPDSVKLANFHRVSDFSFIDQDAKHVSQNDMQGKIYVASFFFTSCPGICPRMRSQLAKVQAQFIDDNKVSIISHSIQPKNDTVQVLREYADKNGVVSGKWHLVTGERDAIYRLARNDYFANEDLGEYVSKKDFLHTENLVLVDVNRHIRGIYNGLNNTSVGHLIEDIKTLRSEL